MRSIYENLPPGPKLPSAIQMIGFWSRPLASMERARARFGKRFTIRLPATPPFVIHSEPEHIKEIFAAPPEVLHPGEGAKLLEPIVGANSLILLDEAPHLSQRKLLLPALHGERLAGLDGWSATSPSARWRAGRATSPSSPTTTSRT